LGRPDRWAGPAVVWRPDVNRSRNARTSGASNVLLADFTKTPRSFSAARTVLLSTPNSLASS
jgi:hypothetical protein